MTPPEAAGSSSERDRPSSPPWWRGEFIVIFAPVALVILVGSALLAWGAISNALTPQLDHEHDYVSLARLRLETDLAEHLDHLRSLVREPAVRSALTVRSDDELGPMSEAFVTLLLRNPEYGQVGWIDEQGQERLLARPGGGDAAPVVSIGGRNLRGAPFFAAAMQLPPSQIGIKQVDTTATHGDSGAAPLSNARIARRLIDDQGRSRGLLVTDVAVGGLLDGLASSHRHGDGSLQLVGPDGQLLDSARSAPAPGLAAEPAGDLRSRHPAVWAQMLASEEGQLRADAAYWTWTTVDYTQSFPGQVAYADRWRIVSALPTSRLRRPLLEAIPAYLGAALLLLLIFGIGTRRLVEANRLRIAAIAGAQRARAEALGARQLSEAQASFRTLFEASSNGQLVVDANGTITMVNRQLLEIFGYPAGELIGKPLSVLIPEASRAAHKRFMAGFLSSPSSRRMGDSSSLSGRRRDGSQVPIEVGLSHFRERDQLYVLANLTDISVRKAAETRRQQLLKIIVDSPDYIAMADADGQLKFLNRAARQLFGLGEASDVTELKVDDVFPPAAARRLRNEGIPQAISHGRWQAETALRAADGREVPVAQLLLCHRDDDGRPLLLSTIMRDLRERDRAAALERYRSGVLEALAQGMPLDAVLKAIVDGIESLDPDARTSILLVDDDGQRLRHGAAGRLPAFYSEAVDGIRIRVGEGSCGTAAASGDLVIVEDLADHPYWADFRDLAQRAALASCWSQPIVDSQRKVLGTFAIYHGQPGRPSAHDMALISQAAVLAALAIERHQTDAALARYRDGLEELVEARSRTIRDLNEQLEKRVLEAEQAVQAKTTFLANMSHEIRTPMNAIIGFSNALRTRTDRPELIDRIDKIIVAGRHLLDVINDILDLSRIEAAQVTLERVAFRVPAVIDHVHSMLAEFAASRGLRLHETLDPALVGQVAIGDPLRLGQVLINLVNNAIKFTDRGEVEISARHEAIGGDRLRLHVAVRDTGIGISAEQKARLFRSFEQADASISRRYGGSGLGLAISARLVRLMNGEIGVDSVPGAGSTFWFTAELGVGTAADLRRQGADEAGIALQAGARLLLVEDNPFNREVACELLEGFGLVVETAEHGAEALQRLATRDYALVLMDLQMPVMDGLEATRQIRAQPRFRDLPIVAMTANAFDEDRRRCEEAGMNGFVAKPIDPLLLRRALARWIGDDDAVEVAPAAAETPPEPPAIDAVDPAALPLIDHALGARAFGSGAAHDRLLRRFAERFAGFDATLAAADAEAALKQLHALRGAAGNVRLSRLAAAAGTLEATIRAGGDSPTVRGALLRCLADTLAAIEAAAPAAAEAGAPQADGPADGPAATGGLQAALDGLRAALDSDDPDIIEPWLAKLTGHYPRARLAALSAALARYDFRAAAAALAALESTAERNSP